jgi:hypothetical protein
MGVATAIGLGIAATGAATQIIQGANAKSQADQAAESAANQLARIQEADRFKSLQLPTLGFELAQQNIQADQANQLRALQESGAAGVLGGLTGLEQQSRAQDLQLAAQANQMQYQRDAMLAQNAQQLEQNRAQRESALASSRLQGAQMASAQGAANVQAGIAGLGQLGGQFALASYKNKPLYETPPTKQLTNAEMSLAGLKATGSTPVPNAFAPEIDSVAGLTNQFMDLRNQSLGGITRVEGTYGSDIMWDPINNQWVKNY